MELAGPAVDIGYVVGDLDAMTAFYAEGLGLEQVTELTLPDDFPGGGRTVRCFAAGDTMLKLWSLHAGPPPRGADDRLGQIGMRYTTLHVIDLAGIVAQLQSFGYPIAVPRAGRRWDLHKQWRLSGTLTEITSSWSRWIAERKHETPPDWHRRG